MKVLREWLEEEVPEEEYPGQYIVIATTNVKHLERFSEADEWRNIK